MIAYQLSLYNVVSFGGGLSLAAPYTAGSGALVLNSVVGLPIAPFRLTVVTLASRGTGLNEVLTVYPVTAVNSLTKTLTLGSPIAGTQDRNYSVGDLAEIRDDAEAITDLNNAVLAVTPTIVTGLTATGTNQATALVLTGNNSIQEVTTTPPGTGVLLPTPVLPANVIVVNAGSNALLVYPPTGGTIWNSASPATLAAGSAGRWVASSATNYYKV